MDIIVNQPAFNENLKGKKIKLTTKDGDVEYSIVRGYYVYDPKVLSLEEYSSNSRNLVYLSRVMEGDYTIEVIDKFPEDIKKHSIQDPNLIRIII